MQQNELLRTESQKRDREFQMEIEKLKRENEMLKNQHLSARSGNFAEESESAEDYFTFSVLKQTPLPVGVDATRRESYLAPEEFAAVFGVEKAVFYKLPKWKQNSLKRDKNLF